MSLKCMIVSLKKLTLSLKLRRHTLSRIPPHTVYTTVYLMNKVDAVQFFSQGDVLRAPVQSAPLSELMHRPVAAEEFGAVATRGGGGAAFSRRIISAAKGGGLDNLLLAPLYYVLVVD